MLASTFCVKIRGTTLNTEERLSTMTAKGDLGQELSRRRTTAQGRGKQERKAREDRRAEERGNAKTLGRCLHCTHLDHCPFIPGSSFPHSLEMHLP